VQPGNTFIDGYSGKERTQAAKKPSGLLKRDPFGVSIDAVFPCGTASTGIRQHVKDNLVVDVSAFCAHVFDTSSYKPAPSEHSRACARVCGGVVVVVVGEAALTAWLPLSLLQSGLKFLSRR
jgi:hypothetical protein